MERYIKKSGTETRLRHALVPDALWRSAERHLKNIPSLSALVLSAMMPHGAESAEIPPDASYKHGIEILREGAEHDTVETVAWYVQSHDKPGRWGSQESGTTEVRVMFQIGDFFREAGVEQNTEVELQIFHTHPIYSKKISGPELVPKDAITVSVPPSNGFGKTNGDTSRLMEWAGAHNMARIEKNLHVGIMLKNYVVDMQGVWEYRSYPESKRATIAPDVYHEWEEVLKLYEKLDLREKQNIGTAEIPELQEMHEDASSAYNTMLRHRDVVDNAIDAWVIASQKTEPETLINSEVYENLIDAYAKTGTEVSFTPFEK